MWDLTIHPLRGPASSLAHHLLFFTFRVHHLAGTPLGVYPPLGAQSLYWQIAWWPPPLGLNVFALCMSVFFYHYLWVFPFGLLLKIFKMYLLGRGFHTLIKNVSFPSPIDVGSHNIHVKFYDCMSCYVMLCYAMLCYAMSSYVMLYYAIIQVYYVMELYNVSNNT